MSQYSSSHGSYRSQRSSNFNDGGRNQSFSPRFQEPYSRRQDGYRNEFEDRPSFDSDRNPRRMIRLEDRGYGNSSGTDTGRIDYSRDVPYSQSSNRNHQLPHLEQSSAHRNRSQPEFSQGSPPYNPINRFYPQDPPQPYDSHDQFQPPGPNQYHPDVDEIRQVYYANSNQGVNSNDQLHSPINRTPVAPFRRNVDHRNKDEIMNHALGSLREKYTEAMNACQPPRQNHNSYDMQNNEEQFKSQTRNSAGPSLPAFFRGPFGGNVNHSNKDEQVDSQITNFSGPRPSQDFANDIDFKSPGQTEGDDRDDDFNEDYRKRYMDVKLAQQKKVQKQMDKHLKKKGFNNIMERVFKKGRDRTRRLFKVKVLEQDPDEEARYAEEYKLIEHVPPVTKKWFQITTDDIRNRDGPVGCIVVIFTPKDTHFKTLETTAETWNMSFTLTSEQCKRDDGKNSWITTAKFNNVELAKTQCKIKLGSKAAATARALWKLYQWYFVVKKGGIQTARTVNMMELKGDAMVKDMIISPNRASQVGNKDLKAVFQNKGKQNLNDLKKQIEIYAKDNTNLNDLVISEDFNNITRKILFTYAKTFESLKSQTVRLQHNRQVVLSKKIGAKSGRGDESKISGWDLIEDILKNRSVYKTTRQYVLYSPGDFTHEIPYKYPNVTYLIP